MDNNNEIFLNLENIVNQLTNEVIGRSNSLRVNNSNSIVLDILSEDFLNNISPDYMYGSFFFPPVMGFNTSIFGVQEEKKADTISPTRFGEFCRGYSDKECSICFEINKDSVKLPCGHCFHETCISKWLLEKSVHCPMCKSDCSVDKVNK
jgi:hypothetical protein